MHKTEKEIKENIKKIADRLINIRERADICYRPFNKGDVYLRCNGGKEPATVNLLEIYPDAKVGDVVYVGTNIYSVMQADIMLYVRGAVSVIKDDQILYDGINTSSENMEAVPIRVEKGDNQILFKCMYREGSKFEFDFMPCEGRYIWWSQDYLYHSRATIPLENFWHEDGVAISRIYNSNEEFDGNFVYPELAVENNIVDFNEVYENEEGMVAYALTYAIKDCHIDLKCNSPYKVYVNGEEQKSATDISLKKDDMLLVKSVHSSAWCFEYSEDAAIGIPFLHTHRGVNDKWLLLGCFGSENSINEKYEPENNIQFEQPYINNSGKKIFWRLCGKNMYLRAYMDTCFFAQWFYANMVGQLGLLKAGEALGEKKYCDYFCDSIDIMARFYEYCKYEQDTFGYPNFLILAMKLTELDYIGTMGVNMIELYKRNPSATTMHCINVLEDAVNNNIRRFPDGTYRREDTMWADDVHMSLPFLARLGSIKNNTKYYDECVRQLTGFKERLYMEKEQIYSHIFFLKENIANNIPWGRGNGWIMKAMSDICENIPDDYANKSIILDMYLEFARGVLKLQDNDGLWHQVLNASDSYAETSCTGLFLLSFCRGMNNGWLSKEEFGESADKAYKGLMTHKIDVHGNIYGVCRGSGCDMNVEYYKNLLDIENDDHGAGIILLALTEYLKYVAN